MLERLREDFDIYRVLHRRGWFEGGKVESIVSPEEMAARKAEAERKSKLSTENALWLLRECVPATGTVAETYLQIRGITLPVPSSVRLHRWHRHESGTYRPCMVAVVQDVHGNAIAIHRTWLAMDGSAKAMFGADAKSKMSLGPCGGGSVRLGEIVPGKALVIGEGIETALSAMQMTGFPGWAALSAGGIDRLQLPPEARDILIGADNDKNGRGQRAAKEAAYRWVLEGRRVRIATPPEVDSDWNDVLLARAKEIRHAG